MKYHLNGPQHEVMGMQQHILAHRITLKTIPITLTKMKRMFGCNY